MTPELPQMWADLYRYFEMVLQTDPKNAKWPEIGKEGSELVRKYNDDPFVLEVVCATIGYWKMKHGGNYEWRMS